MRPQLELSDNQAPTKEHEQKTSERRRAAAELAILVILVEVIMWIVPFTPNPRLAYSGIALIIALLLFACQIRDSASPRTLGLRLDNFFTVLWRISLPFVIFLGLLIVIGLQLETLRIGGKFFSMLVSVPPWALLQQYMLLAFTGRRFRVILGEGRASTIATALLFAILHLPNPMLVVVCAIGGYVWAREYVREPNLLAHVTTHTVASAVLANSLPGWMIKNMVVGYNYFLR